MKSKEYMMSSVLRKYSDRPDLLMTREAAEELEPLLRLALPDVLLGPESPLSRKQKNDLEWVIKKCRWNFSSLITATSVYRLINDVESINQAQLILNLFIYASGGGGKANGDQVTQFYWSLVASVDLAERPLHAQEITYAHKVCALLVSYHGAKDTCEEAKRERPDASVVVLHAMATMNDRALKVVAHMMGLLANIHLALVPCGLKGPSFNKILFWDTCADMALEGWWKAVHEGRQFYWEEEVRHEQGLMAALEGKYDAVAALVEKLWTDIYETPRYDVRSGGADWYEVTGNLNGRSPRKYLLREGTEFPDVVVVTEQNGLEGTNWFVRRLTLDILKENDPGDMGNLWPDLVDLIAYHRIVCREPANREEQRDTPKVRKAITPLQIHEVVRAHFRRLPEGQSPSPDKVAEALIRLGRLPAGYTFVTDFERDRNIDHVTREEGGDRSTQPKPLFRVDDWKVLALLNE